ncbi:MAG: hypothetical protein K9H49_07040 [Bacteroidales bacterium]|nr:hypothetical protein [Bacteroidales bacterium]MCF8404114.1 hypothetical protein [Bacteroidales bacterium]
MRKFLNYMLVATLMAAVIVSCKKDDTDPKDEVKASLVKTIKAVYGVGEYETWEFTYATDGKLTKVDNYWITDFDKSYTYDYSVSGKLSVTRTGEEPVVYDLDSNGRITKEDWGGGEYVAYEYNADGYMVKVTEHWGDADHKKFDILITNGNTVKHTRYDDAGVVNRIKEFTYTPGDNVNNIDQANAIDSRWKNVTQLYGKNSKKLVDYLEYWNGPGDEANTKTTTISYTFDDKNRVATITRSGDGWQEDFEYTYYEE